MTYKQLKLWFDKDLAILLSSKITEEKPDFNADEFIYQVDSKVQSLELKDRVEIIADLLHIHLSSEYSDNIKILLAILGPENPKEIDMFKEYYWIMPIAKYVEKYGLSHLDISLNVIEEITKRNTGEYAIRPFLEKYPEKTLAQMLVWSKKENKHVRRLSSEGVRPRLPWAKKLEQFIKDPTPILPILNNLKDDTSKYVQKSVANCINDIVKDNLGIAKDIIEDWNINPTKQRKWIIKHALRNLVKKEDAWALSIIK